MAVYSTVQQDQIPGMDTSSGWKRFFILLCTPEPRFLLPGAIPVIVGSSLGYAVTGTFDWLAALLALVAMVALNAGSNMVNDYYDHASGNDWLNENPTPFGGGSRYIQNGIVTPRQMLLAGLTSLAFGCILGLILVAMTGSMFILTLGLIGAMGGFFWTAPPVQWCYRCVGEPYIFLLFGPLPVWGAYYLQTGQIDWNPFIPGVIVGLIIAMVAEINSFPDMDADAAVNKRTFVVRYGVKAGVMFYRLCIALTYGFALAGLLVGGVFRWASILYLISLPIGIVAMKLANQKALSTPGVCAPNKITIAYHSIAGLLMSAGFVLSRFVG